MLDIRKCFDTIWHEGLFLKLYDVGIVGKTWRVLRNLYRNFTCNVRVQNQLSEDIYIERGLHQGAPCSMLFFAIFINDLLDELQSFYPCIKICNKVINCFAFADDITIMASCKVDLQEMIDISYRYSCKWRFQFNPTKCIVLTIGRKQSISVKMGPHRLNTSQCESLLGVSLATNKADEHQYINNRVTKCKSMVYATISLGSKKCPLSPSVASRLYRSACLPKLLYGCDIMDADENIVKTMDTFHSNASKIFQGLPTNACSTASIGTIGWSHIQSSIDIMKLTFLWRLLLLPMGSIYKILALRIIFMLIDTTQVNVSCSPIALMLRTCMKYNLLKLVVESITCANYMTMNAWKKKVRGLVQKKGMLCWRIECLLYRSLDLYDHDSRISMSIWWQYSKQNPKDIKRCMLMLKLLLNCYRLGADRCKYCNDHNMSSLPHILFECKSVSGIRNELLCKIALQNNNLIESMAKMDTYSKCKLLLNGFYCEYISEWNSIYTETLAFVTLVYQQYYRDVIKIV